MPTLTSALNLDVLAAAPGATEQTAAAATHTLIREFLETTPFLERYEIDTRLHGSYKNSTNVSRNSDVDIGALSERIFLYDVSALPTDLLKRFNESTSTGSFTFQEYRGHLLASLRLKYGSDVIDGNKAITVPGNTSRLPADVLPCVSFRHYHSNGSYTEGIAFLTKEGKRIVNFPKQHFDHLTEKNKQTNECFKGCIRIMKRVRNILVQEGVFDSKHAPSCYLESLLWNAPNHLYQGGYTEAMGNVLGHLWVQLKDGKADSFVQANNVYVLFHPEFWSQEKAKSLVLETFGRIFPS